MFNRFSTVSRVLRLLCLFSFVFMPLTGLAQDDQPASGVVLPSATAAGPVATPITAGELKPTIALTPAHGYVGQAITVVGQGVASQPGVRVVWLLDEATFGAAVVTRNSDNSYQTTITVPNGVGQGSAQVCATVTATTQAAFTCANFMVDAPPSGSVQGLLPPGSVAAAGVHDASTSAPLSATFQLLDPAGEAVASAAIQSNGAFQLSDVAPGAYHYAIVGKVASALNAGVLTVAPERTSAIAPQVAGVAVDPLTGRTCNNFSAAIAVVKARRTDNTLRPTAFTQATAAAGVSGSFLENVAYVNYARNDFGTYITGVPLNNTFSAVLQLISGAVEKVQYHVKAQGETTWTLIGEAADSGFAVNYDVGLLGPGKATLLVAPVVDGVRQCPLKKTITVLENPMQSVLFQADKTISWNDSLRRYEFSGTMPNLPGLPLVYPFSAPYLGNLDSGLGAGVKVEGSIKLTQYGQITLLLAYAQAKLLGRDLYNEQNELLKAPPSAPRLLRLETDNSNSYVDIGDNELYHFSQDWTVFEGPLASFWGVVTVKASVSVGLDGSVRLTGKIYPFSPDVDLILGGEASPRLTLSIWVELLLGVASAGADAVAQAKVGLGVHLNTRESPAISLANPCIGFKVDLNTWARVNLLFWKKRWNLGGWNLLKVDKPPGCAGFGAATQSAGMATGGPTPPRLFSAPDIASATNGPTMLAVYVKDSTPAELHPTAVIAARFWNPNTEQWDAEQILTDGSHWVSDPVVTIFGPNENQAMVAWTQLDISPNEEEAAGDDLNAILNRQEIYYALWNGQQWSAPVALTTDEVSDGRAAIAGDLAGVSVAWTRDTDGSILTRGDQRIALTEYDATGSQWSPVELLSAGVNSPATMNTQVSIARRFYGNGNFTRVALVWTVDADGNIDTAADRRIALATRTTQTTGWLIEAPPAMPAKAESPSIVLDPRYDWRMHLAFLVRGQDGNGTDAGLGNQNEVWRATVDMPNNMFLVTAAPVKQDDQPVFGERPRIAIHDDEVLTLFRRFGAAGTHGQLGQLAIVHQVINPQLPNSPAGTPIYLTNQLAQFWQPALAINHNDGSAVLLGVQRPALPTGADGLLTAAALARWLRPIPAAENLVTAQLNDSDDPLLSLTFAPAADPALTMLQLSARHAALGSTVTLTATVQNLGRATSSVIVQFYRGRPDAGVLVSESSSFSLTSGVVATATVTLDVQNGPQPIYAKVVPINGGNAITSNDLLSDSLRALTAPTITGVSISTLFVDAMEVTIGATGDAEVAGVRIFRRTTGAYDLVGQTATGAYYDLLLRRRERYCFVAQSFDTDGAVSPFSTEVCAALPLQQVYLPLIQR